MYCCDIKTRREMTVDGVPRIYYRMKDISMDIEDISYDTGYSYEFLSDCVDELVKEEGYSYEKAVREVGDIAYEYDF